MATRTWTGAAGDGSFSNVNNWSAAVVPVTGDTVIVSRSAATGMTTNLDRSGDNAGAGLDLVRFEIERDFAYDIGSAANPLKLSGDLIIDHGNGALYYQTATGSLNRDTDRIIIDKDNISKPVILGAQSGGTDSAYGRIEVTRGANVTIGDGSNATIATTVYVCPKYLPTDVRVAFNGAASITTTNVYIGGGTALWGYPTVGTVEVTEMVLGYGVLEFYGSSLALLNQFGGLVSHKGFASNYAITTYNAINGHLRSTDSPGNKLITTLNRGPQWDMEYNPKLTISATNYIGD